MLTELLEVIRHVLVGSGSEVEVVNLIDFTDRRGHDYAVNLRRCVGYMFATVVAASVVGSPENQVLRIRPLGRRIFR
jgi:hypothetical protein